MHTSIRHCDQNLLFRRGANSHRASRTAASKAIPARASVCCRAGGSVETQGRPLRADLRQHLRTQRRCRRLTTRGRIGPNAKARPEGPPTRVSSITVGPKVVPGPARQIQSWAPAWGPGSLDRRCPPVRSNSSIPEACSSNSAAVLRCCYTTCWHAPPFALMWHTLEQSHAKRKA